MNFQSVGVLAVVLQSQNLMRHFFSLMTYLCLRQLYRLLISVQIGVNKGRCQTSTFSDFIEVTGG